MRRRASESGLFLTELILVILFFSITAAVYVQVFVGAHTLSQDSVNLTEGTLRAQNLAEAFYGCDADMERIKELFPEAEADGDTLTLYFDSFWDPYPAERRDIAFFRAVLKLEPDGTAGSEGMRRASVRVDKNSDLDSDVIYTLSLSQYTGKGLLSKAEEDEP